MIEVVIREHRVEVTIFILYITNNIIESIIRSKIETSKPSSKLQLLTCFLKTISKLNLNLHTHTQTFLIVKV